MRWFAAILLLCFAGQMPAIVPAMAAVSSAQLDAVTAAPAADATIPLSLVFADDDGASRTLGDAVGGTPAVLLFADYTCTNLCGPILAFVAAGLEQSGLAAGKDFHVVVIGLDAKDDAKAARAMKASRIGLTSALADATTVLTGDADAIRTATRAAGYHYAYDAEHDQFAHPAAAYVVTAQGRIVRVLSGLGLSGHDLRLALIDAGEGRVGSLIDRITLRCFGFDPARGIYTASISRWLAIAAGGTVLVLVGCIAGMTLAARRRPAP